jgi:hypothetical protein
VVEGANAWAIIVTNYQIENQDGGDSTQLQKKINIEANQTINLESTTNNASPI